MVNKALFNTQTSKVTPTNTTNLAGGRAYSFSDEHALAQYVVSGTFNGVFYASAGEQLDSIKKLTDKVSSEMLAKTAVYGHEQAHMKDIPAYLLAVLAARARTDVQAMSYLSKAFPRVVTNVKMLLNFVQIVRSGQTGRRSFGTAIKRLIQTWLTSRSGDKLFYASIGHSQPSLADVIKMVRPRPTDKVQEATFGYILGKEYNENLLPKVIRDFEAFKLDNTLEVPDVPFRALTNTGLTVDHWKEIARNMPWNTLRMNLNMLGRNGVFADKLLTRELAANLADESEVRKNNAFPYQLLTTFQNTQDAPTEIQLALQDAMEHATKNVPSLDTEVGICIDLSGSMHCPVTGYGNKVSSVTSCVDVAALVAASLMRTNPTGTVIAWASHAMEVKVNPRDSVMTNSQKFKNCGVGGGTAAHLGLQTLNAKGWKGDAVVYVSDNASWMVPPTFGGYWGNQGTAMAAEWEKYKKRNPKAKLVCIDIQAYPNTQVPDSKDVLNIGGFSDSIWPVIHEFVTRDKYQQAKNFVDIIKAVEL